jgi:cytochrome b561
MTDHVSYDSKTKLFHWSSAALILIMWLLGQSLKFLPDGEPIITGASIHYVVGSVLTLVLLFRISWKFTKGTKLPNALPGQWGAVAKSVHYILYVLLALTLLLGAFALWVHGYSIFELIKVPEFDPGNEELKETVGELHGLFANVLLGLSAAHATMALWHHYVKKDDTLKRMLSKRD